MVGVLWNLNTYIVAYATNTWGNLSGIRAGVEDYKGGFFFRCNILKKGNSFDQLY